MVFSFRGAGSGACLSAIGASVAGNRMRKDPWAEPKRRADSGSVGWLIDLQQGVCGRHHTSHGTRQVRQAGSAQSPARQRQLTFRMACGSWVFSQKHPPNSRPTPPGHGSGEGLGEIISCQTGPKNGCGIMVKLDGHAGSHVGIGTPGHQPADQACQNIPGASSGQPGGSQSIFRTRHVDPPPRAGHQRIMPLEDNGRTTQIHRPTNSLQSRYRHFGAGRKQLSKLPHMGCQDNLGMQSVKEFLGPGSK